MRAFALTVTILCLAALAHGLVDYQLKCNHDEVGIRWPSYHSNSDYYVCTHIGGKQIKMNCNPGELFTFVLQTCAEPGKFIPPPPIDILPASSLNKLPTREQTELQQTGSIAALPKPLYPTDNQPQVILSPQSPPIIIDENSKPPNLESSGHESNNGAQEETSDVVEEPAAVVKPSPPKKLKPAPMPPTPEPTPPVVKKPASIAKKPPTTGKNKQPPKKPSSGARKPPTKPPKKQ